MKINLFEGGRRAMKVVIWLIFVVFSILLVAHESIKSGELILGAFATATTFYIFARLLGWIVRGIFGIPSGRDFPKED
jgi:uncharacterized BrkB/YihY/UPF0761 family membrane protein